MRTRSIRPGFFTNDALGELQPVVRLLFAGLWTVADREGRVLDRPKKLKAELLAYDHVNVDKALDQLAERGFIERYEGGGERCIQVQNWRKHQHPHPREDASILPAPEGYQAGPELTTGSDPEPDLATAEQRPEPDLGAPPARLVASSSSSSRSFNSLRERPPNPPAEARGRPRRRRRNGALGFDEDGPRYEQRTGADGKREWVQVEA
jgi:hypothetical protein